MMFRNSILLLATSLFLAYDAVVMGQTSPSFTIPTDPNVRAFLDLTTAPALPTLSHSIVHEPLGSLYKIEVNYLVSGCQGTAVASTALGALARTITLPTTAAGNGLVTSTITNTLAGIKGVLTPGPATPVPAPLFFAPAPTPNQAQYQYCVEFVLKATSSGNIIDQERYDVKLAANLDGSVSTGTTVVTDIDTNPDSATFTASVTVCNPTSGALVTSNFFRGDSITFCFKSNSFPQASITGIGTFALSLTGTTGTSVDVSPGASAGAGQYVTGLSCNNGGAGVQECRYTVGLGTDAAAVLFAVTAGAPTARAVTASGTLVMKFGSGRRKAVRVLFQQGESFDRNTKTEFVVEAAKMEERNCKFLFPWLMCLISDIFGAIF